MTRRKTAAATIALAWLAAVAIADDGLLSVQQAKLTAFDALPGDSFGHAVDVDGDRLVAGAPFNDDQGSDAGAVYVFERTAGTWSLIDQIIPTTISGGHRFGFSVAIDGDTFVAGAPIDGVGGAVYVYRWDGLQWKQEARLTAGDAAANDLFGYFVAIEDETLVVGAIGDEQSTGAAYVFERSGTTWTETDKLTANDGAAVDWFGRNVTLEGPTIAVGAPLSDPSGVVNAGAAYLFEKSGPGWTQTDKIISPTPTPGAVFGASVAMDGEWLVIAAELDNLAAPSSGAAYIYEQNGSSWTYDACLVAPEPTTGAEFGDAVAIAKSGFGTFVVIGSSLADDGAPGGGAAYVYLRSLTEWKRAATLTPSDPLTHSLFGSALAMDQNTVVVGAPFPETVPGAAYVFVETPVSGAGLSATPFDAGGALKGSLDTPSETDWWVFAGLAGTELEFKVTGKDGLLPTFRLVDHDTDIELPGVSVTGIGNKKVAVSVAPLSHTGRFRVELGSFSNTSGRYVCKTDAELPPTKLTESFNSPQSDDVVTLAYAALPGSTVKLKTSHIDQNEAPEFVALLGPDGPVPFSQTKKPKAKNPVSVTGDVRHDVLGEYVAHVEVQDGGGKVKVVADVSLPKASSSVDEGASKRITKWQKKLIKSPKDPSPNLLKLRDDAAIAHDLIDDPLLAYRVVDRSIAAAFKKGKDFSKAWKATAASGESHSLRFLPTEGVYDPSDFDGLDIPDCPSEPHTVLYVVRGDRTSVSSSQNSAMHLYHALRAADPTLAAGVEVRAFHAPASLPSDQQRRVACLSTVEQSAPLCELAAMEGTAAFWDELAAPYVELCEDVEKACKGEVSLVDEIATWPSEATGAPPSVQAVTQLAWALRHDVLSGRRVVVVAHGQGNATLGEALVSLDAAQRARIGVIAVASPRPFADTGSLAHFQFLTLAHDAVLGLPTALPANLANQWSEFYELPCTNAIEQCALEDALLAAAIHAFDLSYLGNATSRDAILGAIQAAAAAIPAQPLLGQGVLQVTIEWDVAAIVALHVFEPGGDEVSFTDPTGDSGHMDVTHQAGNSVENYYVCQPTRLAPGKYDVYVDNFEQAISISDAVRILVRAGDRTAVRSIPLKGSQDPPLIPIVRIKVDKDGTATIDDL